MTVIEKMIWHVVAWLTIAITREIRMAMIITVTVTLVAIILQDYAVSSAQSPLSASLRWTRVVRRSGNYQEVRACKRREYFLKRGRRTIHHTWGSDSTGVPLLWNPSIRKETAKLLLRGTHSELTRMRPLLRSRRPMCSTSAALRLPTRSRPTSVRLEPKTSMESSFEGFSPNLYIYMCIYPIVILHLLYIYT